MNYDQYMVPWLSANPSLTDSPGCEGVMLGWLGVAEG